MAETYLAFYPPQPFWVIDAPNHNDLPAGSNDFYTLMAEVMFTSATKHYVLKVCRDGLLMVQIESLERELQQLRAKDPVNSGREQAILSRYYHYLNAILLLLDTAVSKHQNYGPGNTALAIGDAFRITLEEGKLSHAGVPSKSQNIHLRFASTYTPNIPLSFDPRLGERWARPKLTEATLNDVVAELEKMLGDFDKIKILSQIMVSSGHFQLLDFTASLVQAWFVIEYFLNIFWVKFLIDKQIGFTEKGQWQNSQAIKFLTGKEFTASIMSSILKYGGAIEGTVFNKLDKVRKKRNAIAHSADAKGRYIKLLRKPSSSDAEANDNIATANDCINAFDVIKAFVNREYDIDLHFPNGLSYTPL